MNPEEIEGVLGSPEEKGSLTGDWDGHDLTGQGYEWWFYRNERGDVQVGLLVTNERLAKWTVAPSP